MKKKNKTANLIMVAIIVLIAAGGVFLAGRTLGWFGSSADAAVLSDIRGIVSLQRDGVAFNVTDDTELRKGDVISIGDGATAAVLTEDGSVVLGSGASLSVEDPRKGFLDVSLSLGEAFACTKDAQVDITVGEEKIGLKNASAAFSVRSGAQTVSVLSGEAAGVKAGNVKEWVGGQASVRALDINSLNDFVMAQISSAGDDAGLVISRADVEDLQARRLAEAEAARLAAEAEKKAAEEAARAAEEAAKAEAERKAAEEAAARAEAERLAAEEAAARERAEAERRAAEEAAARAAEEAERREAEEAAARAEAERIAAEEAAARAAEEAARAEAERLAAEEAAARAEEERLAAEAAAAQEAAKPHCTISIYCSTILDNWDSLDPAVAPYVPSNGVILATASVAFTEGDTVFDVLARVCSERGIQLESSYNPVWDSRYIEGINNIYEFDCGETSGWVYKVNGWFPNYGCSAYVLSDGDDIAWLYSCIGAGADVGATY